MTSEENEKLVLIFKADNGCLGSFGRGRTRNSGDTRRVGAYQPLIRRFPNGVIPPCASRVNPDVTSGWVTRGSETSQYPEEKKTIVIPLVAASESGKAQTPTLCVVGVVGSAITASVEGRRIIWNG